MKILMVITEADLGGAQRHVLDISRHFIGKGHQVVVAVGGDHRELLDAAAQLSPAVPTLRVRALTREIHPTRDIRALVQLIRIIRTIKPDVVHCHSSKAGVIGSIAGRLAGATVVYTAHGFAFREDRSRWVRWLYRVIERIATWFRHRVIAVSRSDAEVAVAHGVVPAQKMTTIHNGIDTTIADTMLTRDDARTELSAWCGVPLYNKKIVVSIANLYSAKNIPLLLRAFEFVVRREPEARLMVIGDGEERPACERIIAATPALQRTVFLVGKRQSAARMLRGADVLALSSTKEGLPYVILEAKLAGVPIVATRVGGVPEFGEDHDLRLVVPHSPEMLAEQIVHVLRDGASASRPLPVRFTLDGMAAQIERLYEELLQVRRTL